ncbi:flagellar hook-length control protein FliK [Arthrobacter pityocampae]|uniref:flagellar hook-length control protein FliK n=1 Tax=Arthrobacter pityocampae TaxID=547334 RepID=UPI0011B0E800|nr:flagellar hook-length control protein FliK [Arthrobacter pityocampae]
MQAGSADGVVPGLVPASETIPPEATPTGAGAEGEAPDAVDPGAPVATETGMQAAADSGAQTPNPDATTGQPGADLQPASGRVDLPAPAHPMSAGAVVGSSDASAAAPVRPAAAPLPQQLGGHAFVLAQSAADAPGGTSTITVTVAPDDLGPITIRASFTSDGTRLEFFSSTDTGREALKQALPELRREASSSGLSASLDLGTGTPGDHRDDHRDGPFRSTTTTAPTARGTIQDSSWTRNPAAGSSALDLFA